MLSYVLHFIYLTFNMGVTTMKTDLLNNGKFDAFLKTLSPEEPTQAFDHPLPVPFPGFCHAVTQRHADKYGGKRIRGHIFQQKHGVIAAIWHSVLYDMDAHFNISPLEGTLIGGDEWIIFL